MYRDFIVETFLRSADSIVMKRSTLQRPDHLSMEHSNSPLQNARSLGANGIFYGCITGNLDSCKTCSWSKYCFLQIPVFTALIVPSM